MDVDRVFVFARGLLVRLARATNQGVQGRLTVVCLHHWLLERCDASALTALVPWLREAPLRIGCMHLFAHIVKHSVVDAW
jgi:hypothetical protein